MRLPPDRLAPSTWNAIRREHRALLCCARVTLDDASRRELEALVASGVDTTFLVREARRHGVTPLLRRHVQEVSPAAWPSGLLDELRAETQAIALASLAAASELVSILSDLRSAGVHALPIKGPVSAAVCYGDLGLRVFGDLDLLVAPADAPAARGRLEARGYAPRFVLSPDWFARLLRSDSELAFSHRDGRRRVDLHWSLLPQGHSFTPGRDGVFEHRAVVQLGSSAVPTLGVDATLLFLLLHGIKHEWHSLGWLCDVAELLRRHPQIDWAEILSWSAQPGRARLIDVGLRLVSALLGAPVPARVLARGDADSAVARITDMLARKLFAPHPERPSRIPTSIFSLPYFLAMGRSQDRLRFLHDAFLRPTPLEWQAVPLPASLAPLFYLVRPVRLLWRHAGPRRASSTQNDRQPAPNVATP